MPVRAFTKFIFAKLLEPPFRLIRNFKFIGQGYLVGNDMTISIMTTSITATCITITSPSTLACHPVPMKCRRNLTLDGTNVSRLISRHPRLIEEGSQLFQVFHEGDCVNLGGTGSRDSAIDPIHPRNVGFKKLSLGLDPLTCQVKPSHLGFPFLGIKFTCEVGKACHPEGSIIGKRCPDSSNEMGKMVAEGPCLGQNPRLWVTLENGTEVLKGVVVGTIETHPSTGSITKLAGIMHKPLGHVWIVGPGSIQDAQGIPAKRRVTRRAPHVGAP